MNIEECCRILGITPAASLDEINQAYRDLVKQRRTWKMGGVHTPLRALSEKTEPRGR